MKYQYLTPEDQNLLDPYGNCRRYVRSLSEQSFSAPPSRWYRLTPDQAQALLLKIISQYRCDRHLPYFQYVDEMWAKYGPQGGNVPLSTLLRLLEPYYERANSARAIVSTLKLGRDYLVRRIKQVMHDNGGPAYLIPPRYATAAGCPTGLHKGDWLAETVGFKPWRHAYPTLLGYRNMRCSPRLIFMDSVNNVRYVECELTSARVWLKRYLPEYFAAWCNPEDHLNGILTDALRHCDTFVETDYKKMDQGFSLELVREMILPVYEVLLPDSFLSFAAMIEELFNQPVYMGDYLIVGLHNMFSGIGPTNDFETIYTIELVLGVAIVESCLDKIQVVANGDDATVALRHTSLKRARAFMDRMIDVSNQADMLIHSDEKSRIVQGETRFCRKVYYPGCHKDINGNLAGNYPINLALNSIIQPERPSKDPGIAAAADLQRMDNCYGVPGWTDFVQMLAKYSTHSFSTVSMKDANLDWWYRLYGETWEPTSSPAFRLIQRYKSEPIKVAD